MDSIPPGSDWALAGIGLSTSSYKDHLRLQSKCAEIGKHLRDVPHRPTSARLRKNPKEMIVGPATISRIVTISPVRESDGWRATPFTILTQVRQLSM
ncbi:MAG: hypothetical protein DWQ41_21335 [Planctomycetota bacterium]|nr:MAG: hypothetical protein DWQ41_21335 [Planctomycetota bacterium]